MNSLLSRLSSPPRLGGPLVKRDEPPAKVPSEQNRALLPDDCTPSLYDLKLEPDLDKLTFSGSVGITLSCDVATSEIWLHARDVAFPSVEFHLLTDIPAGPNHVETRYGSARRIQSTEVAFIRDNDMVRIFLPEVLPVGKDIGVLYIPRFYGEINNSMAGFYRNQYQDDNGKPRYLAATHFEPIDARRAFPCFDEPAHKAVFEITITVSDPKLTAISCMLEKRRTQLGNGRVEFEFMPTPKMSTYIVAWAVGELDFVQTTLGEGNPSTVMRCFCTQGLGKVKKLNLALSVAKASLEWYNQFFGVKDLGFELPKLDCIALPDFPIGAMENWGLVTYREILMLADEKTVSTTVKQRLAGVIAHEFAHMWFGNLVTMEWWDDLWLKVSLRTLENEG